MNYLKQVWKILKKSTWTSFSASLKGTVICLVVMAAATGSYWLIDLIYQWILRKG
ncbi:preprotein translocase subunit SecE (plasmid) [Lactobacillus sp. PV037]|uniref:preprotein translocase subunit SecE n=1 Tax=Lactobacillus sp. PV037 TaxID=2594496 RepID=UPI00223F90B4|nr:preprotein translocase subunit SecE [Lactobacillus sp. PV037]QNQ82980.1 preprotein translocase subunit SecE [Lactobacillus sp. PV037]